MYRASSLVKKIAKECYFHKGIDIKIFDVKDVTPMANYYVVLSALNARQIKGFQEIVEKTIESADGGVVKNVEGRHGADWVIVDGGDIVVNIFSKEERERVKFDDIYRHCNLVEFEKGDTKEE
jgi:ribosome-associated protein